MREALFADFPLAEYQQRYRRLRSAMEGHGLDAMLVTNRTNHHYFTGFCGEVFALHHYYYFALLPRDEPKTLAFYGFHRETRKLSLRTYRIEPLPGGSYRVFERPTPDQPEHVATYSPTGRLIERRMPDGRVFLATTPQELRRIWGAL